MSTQEHIPTASIYTKATQAAEYIRSRLPSELHHPTLAIVCGSGLGLLQHGLQAAPSPKIELQYDTIPHFPKSTVEGHEGKMVFGFMAGKEGARVPVALLVGRAHYYEGHSMDLVTFATRVCRVLDIGTMLATNAAGGLNPTYRVGDIVLLHDHINLAGLSGLHPLRGPNDPSFGPRFPPLSDAYSLSLRRRAHLAWSALDVQIIGGRTLHEGVYAYVGGPSYETRAECRLLRTLGADVVGMSTVPEVIVARHSGMRVLAVSLVTNEAVLEAGMRGDDERLKGMSEEELEGYLARGMASHMEVLEAGREAAKTVQALVEGIVGGLGGV